MKKFRFRLEPLLKLRKRHEDEKKRVVGAFMADISRHQQRALEMAHDLRQQGQAMTQGLRGNIKIDRIGHYQRYVSYTRYAITKEIETVEQIQRRLQSARQELVEAARQRRILEKLKERRKERHETELQRRETRQQDEIAASRFLYGRRLTQSENHKPQLTTDN